MSVNEVNDQGADNSIVLGENVTLSGSIRGENNTIIIGNARVNSRVRIYINGNNNTVKFDDSAKIDDLAIRCGTHVAANNTTLKVGRLFSIEPRSEFLLPNHRNKLEIGDDCLFSNTVTIRCGEAPHLIFDSITGEYIDRSAGVSIGNHVWVGERVYITKRGRVADNCIVAACAVVTGAFSDSKCVIGGNPAKIVRRNVHWVRNVDFIEKGSIFEFGYQAYRDSINFGNE